MNIAFSIFKIKPHGTFLSIKYLNTADYRKCLKYLVDTNELTYTRKQPNIREKV